MNSNMLLRRFDLPVFFFLFTGVFSIAGIGVAQTVSDGVVKKTGAGVIEPVNGTTFFQAVVDLGDLPGGGQCEVNLVLKNPSEQGILFEAIKPLCGCSVPVVESKEIAGRADFGFHSKINIPDRADTPEGEFGFRFVDGDKNLVFNLRLKYRIAGLIALRHRQLIMEISQGDLVEFDVPIVLTPPIEFKNLSVSSKGDLTDVVLGLSLTGTPVLRLSAHSQAVVDGPIYGVVTVKDSLTGKNDSLALSVRKKVALTIGPETCWLRRNNETNEFETNVLIAYTPSESPRAGIAREAGKMEQEASEETEIVSIHVSAKDLPDLKAHIKKIRKNLFKVKLTVPFDSSFERSGALAWSVDLKGGLSLESATKFDLEK